MQKTFYCLLIFVTASICTVPHAYSQSTNDEQPTVRSRWIDGQLRILPFDVPESRGWPLSPKPFEIDPVRYLPPLESMEASPVTEPTASSDEEKPQIPNDQPTVRSRWRDGQLWILPPDIRLPPLTKWSDSMPFEIDPIRYLPPLESIEQDEPGLTEMIIEHLAAMIATTADITSSMIEEYVMDLLEDLFGVPAE